MASNKLYLAVISVVISLWSYGCKNTAASNENGTKKTDTVCRRRDDTVCCVCAGMLQSPINIVERTAIPAALPAITFTSRLTKMYIQNDKKAIKVAPIDGADSSNYLIFNYQKYQLKDFHFHHKSEHLINGLPDSMEVHVVYQSKQTKSIVVVGLLIGMGRNPNPALSTIWNEFPPRANYERKNLDTLVNVSSIINYVNTDIYYSYVGSLTTPEYAEGVAWIVLKRRLVLTGGQIKQFASYYFNNARKTYPINNRLIYTGRR